MGRIALILLSAAVLASCESAKQQLSPTSVPQASLSTTTHSICGGDDFSPPVSGVYAEQDPITDNVSIYAENFWPVECGTDQLVRDGVWFKVFLLREDGRQQLLGEDHRPFTVPTTVGPRSWDGNPVSNRGLNVWTFIIGGRNKDVAHTSRFINIELWGPGGKIASQLVPGIQSHPISEGRLGLCLVDDGYVYYPYPTPTSPTVTPQVYGSGFWPVNCASNELVRTGTWYKVYAALTDGRRLLLGEDRHPFTVPTTVGPQYGGHPITDNGGLNVWTFVVNINKTDKSGDVLYWGGRNVLVVELWGPNGKIGETLAFIEI